ncbi:MAG: hypothetical protein KC766_39805, partial [Myxococcales bacterium]|nr:hypothetical protein [Myxococcales bacterium]
MSEKPAPWLHPRGVAQVVQSWRDSGKVQRCLAVERLIERGDARHVGFEALERPLPNALVQALEGRGVSQLYSH